MPLFKCAICQAKRSPFKAFCQECQILFNIVHENLGKVGLGQLMDTLIQTGIDKKKIKKFLDAEPEGKSSIMDQITASLTNDLAEGMGVKESGMTPDDVKKIRENPMHGVSTKPIDK